MFPQIQRIIWQQVFTSESEIITFRETQVYLQTFYMYCSRFLKGYTKRKNNSCFCSGQKGTKEQQWHPLIILNVDVTRMQVVKVKVTLWSLYRW